MKINSTDDIKITREMVSFDYCPEHVALVAHAFTLQLATAQLLHEIAVHEITANPNIQQFLGSAQTKEDHEKITSDDFKSMLQSIEAFSYVSTRASYEIKNMLANRKIEKRAESVSAFIDGLLNMSNGESPTH